MNKNNLILLIKNQMSDKQKNDNALHLNTLLLSSIDLKLVGQYLIKKGK